MIPQRSGKCLVAADDRAGAIAPWPRIDHSGRSGRSQIGSNFLTEAHEQVAGASESTCLTRSEGDAALEAAIVEAIARKPRGHDFTIDRASRPAVARHMSVTGG